MAEISFWAGVLDATVSASTVLILAALGELISERAGVLNIGIEGIMLSGALTGFATAVVTANPVIGLIAAALVGAGMSFIHAFFSITLKSDQVISGFMVTLLGIGLTTALGRSWTAESIQGIQPIIIPIVGPTLIDIPLIGQAFFQNPWTDYLALILIPIVYYILEYSNFGLELRSVGEDPETADSVGIDVTKKRYMAVLIGGLFMGAAGAHLTLAFTKLWVPNIVSGRGWISLALVIFAQWRPERVILGAYLFALVIALEIRSQGVSLTASYLPPIVQDGIGFVTDPLIMSTYPFIVTILVLALISRRGITQETSAPSAILEPYLREGD